MGLFTRQHSGQAIASGDLLVSDFETAMNNLSTAETAKYVAEQTESRTMQTILSSGTGNNIYTTPGDLSDQAKEELLHESLNAHMQKAQSEQISAYANSQVADLERATRKNYVGKKVKITVIEPQFKPLESVWQDSASGKVTSGEVNYRSIKGMVEDLSLTKNMLVVRPDWKSRLLFKDRKFFLVYVINPENMQPAVKIDVI